MSISIDTPLAGSPCRTPQRQQADAHIRTRTYSFGTGAERGTRRHDVVDEENVFALQPVGMFHSEKSFGVGQTFLAISASLGGVVVQARQAVCRRGNARQLRHATGYLLRLVVTAAAHPLPRQRNWKQEVNVAEKSGRSGFTRQKRAKVDSDVRLAGILEPMDNLTRGIAFLVEKQRSRALDGDDTAETLLQQIVRNQVEIRARESAQTSRAHMALAGSKPLPAHRHRRGKARSSSVSIHELIGNREATADGLQLHFIAPAQGETDELAVAFVAVAGLHIPAFGFQQGTEDVQIVLLVNAFQLDGIDRGRYSSLSILG